MDCRRQIDLVRGGTIGDMARAPEKTGIPEIVVEGSTDKGGIVLCDEIPAERRNKDVSDSTAAERIVEIQAGRRCIESWERRSSTV